MTDPSSRLPCPICTARLDPTNLDRHLAKVHPGASASADVWLGRGALGIAPCALTFDGDAIVLRHWLGLAKRRVAFPCEIEIGSLWGTQLEAGSPPAADYNAPATKVRTGTYLRLIGGSSITIGCRQAGELRERWDRVGWRDGKRRQGCDITVRREALIAVEYALASRGLLVPAGR